jgi:hypothetical protein
MPPVTRTSPTLKLIGLGLALSLLAMTMAPGAEAATRNAYGKKATTVAAWGHCKNVRKKSNGGEYAYSALVCDLRGHRINILTFTSKKQEVTWIAVVCTFFPDQWLMVGTGFVITAKDGNRAAAKAGKNVYDGQAYQCKLLV